MSKINPTLRAENSPVGLGEAVPKLKLSFPRRLTSLHQIEVTSRCNLRCPYCIHPKMAREKADMPLGVFVRAIEWVRRYIAEGTQKQLNLAGTGESTMHPLLPTFLSHVRETLGWDLDIIFATNGVGYDEDYVKRLAEFKPRAFVSLHRPEKGGLARVWWEKVGCLAGVSDDPSTNANDWAGQVDWPNSTRFKMPCQWLRQGLAFVLSDGSITTCCLDGDRSGVVGHVEDPIGSVRLAPYKLCGACHQEIAVEGFDQWEGRGEPKRTGLPVVD